MVSALANNRAHLPPEQLKVGLRFLLHPLFLYIMNYWGFEIGQLAPNGIRQVVAFILICKAFGILDKLRSLQENVRH